MTNKTEPTKRANVEGLNDTALSHVKRTKEEEEKIRECTRTFIEVVFGKDEEENKGGKKMDVIEERRKDLFISLLKGNRSDIRDKLLQYVFDGEYTFCHDGGEPDMEHILAVKLLECMGINKLV